MKQPDVSVIVPVYGVEPYLRRCLDSLRCQTGAALEIILVDDGSPDNCGAICDEYAAKDDRILVIHQENAGVSAARNAALAVASGRYIGFVDADDWVDPDMYEYLTGLAERYGADIVQCGIYMEEENACRQAYVSAQDIGPFRPDAMGADQWERYSNGACNKLYRAAAIKPVRFDTAFRWGEDLIYNVEAMLRAERICLGAAAKYHYFQRPGSACHETVTTAHLMDRRLAVEHAAELLAEIPSSCTNLLTIYIKSLLHTASGMVYSGKPEDPILKAHLRSQVRQELPAVLRRGGLSIKDRLKCVLIAYAWPVYRWLLAADKDRQIRKTD